MSRFSNLLSYSWKNCINGKPFEIMVFARTVEEARQEVFAIFAEIEHIKPRYEALDKEISSRIEKEYNKKTTAVSQVPKKSWAQVTSSTSPAEKTINQLYKEQASLAKDIPANFFNGCYAAGTFDYTSDKGLGYCDEDDKGDTTLGEFIQTTDPKCCGAVRTVSFRSCLDG
jgi:hypothetical protein